LTVGQDFQYSPINSNPYLLLLKLASLHILDIHLSLGHDSLCCWNGTYISYNR